MDADQYKHFENFRTYRCTKCKRNFKLSRNGSGWCSNCEKPKERLERYREASLN